MKRLALICAALSALQLPVAASAAEEKGKKNEGGQAVSISPVALPIVLNGKLVNYVFVTVRVDLTDSANASKLREREPYFRDALVRAGHRTPFTLPSDLTKVDAVKLQTAMMREAQIIAGPGAVKSVTLVEQEPKSLRVSTGG